MELSKKEELLALSSAMYLMGLELEASRVKLEELLDEGRTLTDQRVVQENDTISRLSVEFSRLEKRYLQLEKEIKPDMP